MNGNQDNKTKTTIKFYFFRVIISFFNQNLFVSFLIILALKVLGKKKRYKSNVAKMFQHQF